MGLWGHKVMVVVTQVNTFVKTHIIVHLKFTITSQPCRVGTCTVFSPKESISRRLDGCSPWGFIFCFFCFSPSWTEDAKSLERSLSQMDFVALPTFKEGVDTARPPIPSIQGLRPLEGREVGG